MTTTPVVTLADFLLARITEDEREAADWPDILEPPPPSGMWVDPHGHPIYAPRRRVLAECEAKRRIVAEHSPAFQTDNVDPGAVCRTCSSPWSRNDETGGRVVAVPCPTLRLLALPFADHPDYREEWKP